MSICSNHCNGMSPAFPYVTCFKSPRGNFLTPNWKFDPHRVAFCRKFSSVTPDACSPAPNPDLEIHKALFSLDKFSIPPLYRKGGFQGKFRCKPCRENCTGRYVRMKEADSAMDCCPSLPQLQCPYPNGKPYEDVVCGLCVKNDESNLNLVNNTCINTSCNKEEDAEVGDCDLPFVVYPLWNLNAQLKSTPRRTGAEQALTPSSYRSLDTVSQLEYRDFFKMKSPEHLALYRSKMAVNHARPPVCLLSADDNSNDMNLDLTKPIYINAKMMKMKQKGKSGNGGTCMVSVSIPGPISLS